MIWRYRKARALFTVWFAHMSVYRAEILIWMLSGSIPLIMMAVWIGKARADGGSVDGYTPPGFAAYFLAIWLSQQLVVSWVAWELDRLVRMGELSSRLLRPMDPIWEQVATHSTEKVVRLPFMAAILFGGTLLVPGTHLIADPWHALAYCACIVPAFAIRFLIAYCTGLLAFWTSQVTALDELYYLVASFLSGAFAPLAIFPSSIRAVVEWLPFPYVTFYPVQVLTGAINGSAILHVLVVQLIWVSGLWALRGLLWRYGIRRYGAVGA